MKLNDNSGSCPSGSSVAEGARRLDENVNERKSRAERRGPADHDDPNVTTRK